MIFGLIVLGNFPCPQLSFFLVNVGCGNGADWSCVGRDLAILAACNHTIQTRGSFGQWAAYLSGGDSYTEYGPMMSRKLWTLNKKWGDAGGSLTCNCLTLFHSGNLQRRFTEGIHQVESNSFHLTKQLKCKENSFWIFGLLPFARSK